MTDDGPSAQPQLLKKSGWAAVVAGKTDGKATPTSGGPGSVHNAKAEAPLSVSPVKPGRATPDSARAGASSPANTSPGEAAAPQTPPAPIQTPGHASSSEASSEKDTAETASVRVEVHALHL